MPPQLASLCPFISILLFESSKTKDTGKLQAGILEVLRKATALRKDVSSVVSGGPIKQSHGLQVGFYVYRLKVQTPWTTDTNFSDEFNHLVMLWRLGSQFGLYASDPDVLRSCRKKITDKSDTHFQDLHFISAGRLNAAFVRGETQTLWLSGTHRRVASKVDNKVISGMDLRYALDPLGDQTFYFTAARCKQPFGNKTQSVGVSPKKSSIWACRSATWDDLAKGLAHILNSITNQKRVNNTPLPVLAISANDAVAKQLVKGAFDAALIPPELLDVTTDPKQRQDFEKWNDIRFEITPGKGMDFMAKLYDSSGSPKTELGEVAFTFQCASDGTLSWTLAKTPNANSNSTALFDEIFKAMEDHLGWIKVWYESGHVFAGGEVFALRHREMPFEGFHWNDFKKFQCDKEKPDPLNANNIGKSDSLFCWVKNHWRPGGKANVAQTGWLACNDGSMEIADFIHLDEKLNPPVLTLIHVKGANTDSPNRKISVSAYELVVGQAIKNLRHVDQELLAGNFMNHLDKRITNAVWHCGQPAKRADMLAAFKKLNANYARRVVVIQPHVTKTALQSARTTATSDNLRAKQLDTLLLAAQTNCQGLGASFHVIADGA